MLSSSRAALGRLSLTTGPSRKFSAKTEVSRLRQSGNPITKIHAGSLQTETGKQENRKDKNTRDHTKKKKSKGKKRVPETRGCDTRPQVPGTF